MGFSEESFFKSTYKKIYGLLAARNEYYKVTNGGGSDSDNEEKSLQKLDKFLA